MASSALNQQTWNAKAANVQNADGSPIYYAGIWTLKSSTNVTTFSVSDAGVVTTNYNGTPTTATTVAGFGYAGTTRMQIKMNNSTGVIAYNNNAGFANQWTVNDVLMGQMDSTGAWTLGPAAGNPDHILRGRVVFFRTETSGAATAFIFRDGSNDQCGYVNIDATANTVAYTNSSDSRLKTNHREFDGLSLIAEMRPSKYERLCNPGVDEIGLVAQELYEIFPQAVVVGNEDVSVMPWGIDYGKLTSVLVRAVQQQQAQIDALRLLIKGA